MWFAELVRRGWHVDLVSTPLNYMTGTVPVAYSGRRYVQEAIDGISHHWVPSSGRIHASRGRRAMNYVTFAATSTVRSATLPRPDVIIASSPPLTAGAVGPLLARRFRRPWLLEVRDPWPQAGASIGWLSNKSRSYRALDWLASQLASSAHSVLVPTPGLVETLERQGAKRVHVVTGAVTDLGIDLERRARTRASLGIADSTCVFLYLGALGIANGLDTLVDAIAALPADAPAAFVLIGDGSHREYIEGRVAREQLDKVRILPAVPKEEGVDFLAASDVCLHLMRPDPLFAYNLATKLFEYFGAHRPFITTVPGVAERLARESGGGFAPTASELTDEFQRWIGMSADERRRRGDASFEFGRKTFDPKTVVDNLELALHEAIADGGGPARARVLSDRAPATRGGANRR